MLKTETEKYQKLPKLWVIPQPSNSARKIFWEPYYFLCRRVPHTRSHWLRPPHKAEVALKRAFPSHLLFFVVAVVVEITTSSIPHPLSFFRAEKIFYAIGTQEPFAQKAQRTFVCDTNTKSFLRRRRGGIFQEFWKFGRPTCLCETAQFLTTASTFSASSKILEK